MHESIILPCIFGCVDCRDEFRHYIVCPILWQLAKEALDIRETSFAVGHRLCLSDVNTNKIKLLGYCHLLYHSLRKDSECFDQNGQIKCSEVVQRRASSSSRALIPLVENLPLLSKTGGKILPPVLAGSVGAPGHLLAPNFDFSRLQTSLPDNLMV